MSFTKKRKRRKQSVDGTRASEQNGSAVRADSPRAARSSERGRGERAADARVDRPATSEPRTRDEPARGAGRQRELGKRAERTSVRSRAEPRAATASAAPRARSRSAPSGARAKNGRAAGQGERPRRVDERGATGKPLPRSAPPSAARSRGRGRDERTPAEARSRSELPAARRERAATQQRGAPAESRSRTEAGQLERERPRGRAERSATADPRARNELTKPRREAARRQDKRGAAVKPLTRSEELAAQRKRPRAGRGVVTGSKPRTREERPIAVREPRTQDNRRQPLAPATRSELSALQRKRPRVRDERSVASRIRTRPYEEGPRGHERTHARAGVHSAAAVATAPRRDDKPVRELSAEPHPGHFLLTTRQGSEQDLVEELMLLGVTDPAPRVLAPALVLAPKVPKRDKRPVDLTFARQGFPILQSVHTHDLEQTAARIARSLRGQLERARQYALHVWVPDSELGNPLSSMADELEAKVAARLADALPNATRVDDASLRRLASLPLAQVCLIDPERAVAGVTYSNAALSLAPGGRTRVRLTGDFPSRAARKLEEALAWLGVEPSAGDVCVDLGAAPGGWTYVLAERRARVIAVDPAMLKPEILAKKGVRHVQESAFTFTPDGEVDWLFCDMAWRPLEAAALLAKWGRKHWARMMVANIKLPMKKKAELLARVRDILENEGGWKHVRMRQLYHDRDEITLTAHLS